MGDFNARLHTRAEIEEDIIGKHIFGKGQEYIDNEGEGTRDNREALIAFCKANGFRICNTDFEMSNEGYCTYKEIATKSFAAPFNEERFAMLDLCLIKSRWRNSIKDVEAKPRVFINSDHALVETKIRTKLKRKYKKMSKNKCKVCGMTIIMISPSFDNVPIEESCGCYDE